MKCIIAIVLCMGFVVGCCTGKPREAAPDPYEGTSQVEGVIKDVKFLDAVSSYHQPIIVTFEDGRVGNFELWVTHGPFVFENGKHNTIISNSSGYVLEVVQREHNGSK